MVFKFNNRLDVSEFAAYLTARSLVRLYCVLALDVVSEREFCAFVCERYLGIEVFLNLAQYRLHAVVVFGLFLTEGCTYSLVEFVEDGGGGVNFALFYNLVEQVDADEAHERARHAVSCAVDDAEYVRFFVGIYFAVIPIEIAAHDVLGVIYDE